MEYELILKPLSALAPRDDPKYAAKMSEQIKRYVSQRFLEQLRSEELYTSGCLLRIKDPSAVAVATNVEKVTTSGALFSKCALQGFDKKLDGDIRYHLGEDLAPETFFDTGGANIIMRFQGGVLHIEIQCQGKPTFLTLGHGAGGKSVTLRRLMAPKCRSWRVELYEDSASAPINLSHWVRTGSIENRLDSRAVVLLCSEHRKYLMCEGDKFRFSASKAEATPFVWVPDSMTKAVNIVECLMAALVPGAAPHPAMNAVSPKYREICTKIQGVIVSSEGDPPFKKSAKESLLAKVRSCLEEARSQVWRGEEAIVSVYSLLMIFRKGATRSSRQSRQCLQSF